MSQDARNIMQDLRNRVGSQGDGWSDFKAVSTTAYAAAYKLHKGALGEAHENIVLSNERCWKIFTMLFGLVSAGAGPLGEAIAETRLGRWAGRLIEDVENADALAGEMFETALDQISDTAKDLVKDTQFAKMAKGAVDSRPFEPVVDDPFSYYLRMEHMLKSLAVKIERPLDELVTRAGESWSKADAQIWSLGFTNNCPYMTDLPDDLGQGFASRVQKTAELTMWIDWASVRDESWWQKQNARDVTGNSMVLWEAVLDRLIELHVPPGEVSSVRRVGNTFGSRPVMVLDMVKFIRWAKHNKPGPALTSAELQLMDRLLHPQQRVRDQLQCYCSRAN